MNSQTTELPELPDGKGVIRHGRHEDDGAGWIVDFDCEGPLSHQPCDGDELFTADQMRDYARVALEHAQRVAQPGPQWIVNDLGELGVRVGNRFFFLYKGDNIEYGIGADSNADGIALHDDMTPMRYRMVGKHEFGETCWPLKWVLRGSRDERYTEELTFHPGLSHGKPEDGDWRPLPAATAFLA